MKDHVLRYGLRCPVSCRALIVVAGFVALSACDNSSSRTPSAPPDTDPPAVTLFFPGANGVTDADHVLVTGSATDAGTVTGVWVNATAATTDDGFATWRARVPLEPGINRLEVAAEDDAGNRDALAAVLSINATILHERSFGASLSEPTGTLFVIDNGNDTVMTVDVDTGARALLTDGRDTASGLTLRQPFGVAQDLARNRLYISDVNLGTVTVDIATGQRALLAPSAAEVIVYDEVRDRVLVMGGGRPMTAIDAVTGDSRVIDDAEPGCDELRVNGIAYADVDQAAGLLYAYDISLGAVVRIDLATDCRQVLVDTELTDLVGGRFSITGLGVDEAAGRLYLIASTTPRIVSVDLNSGVTNIFGEEIEGFAEFEVGSVTSVAYTDAERSFYFADNLSDAFYQLPLESLQLSPVSAESVPEVGTDFDEPRGLALDSAGRRALVTDWRSTSGGRSIRQAIYLVDLDTGARQRIYTDSGFRRPIVAVFDESRDRALIAYASFDLVSALSLTTGELVNFSTVDGNPADTEILAPAGMVMDRENDRVLIADAGNDRIIGIDLETGAREVVVDSIPGQLETAFQSFLFRGMVLDADGQRVFVLANRTDSIIEADLVTGERRVVSGPGVPNDDFALASPASLAADFAGDRLFVTNEFGTNILVVDIETGQRSRLREDGVAPSGPQFTTARAMAYDERRQRLLLLDLDRRAIFAVEPTTGDRVIVSR